MLFCIEGKKTLARAARPVSELQMQSFWSELIVCRVADKGQNYVAFERFENPYVISSPS